MEEKDNQQQISVDVVPTSSTAVTRREVTPPINKVEAFGIGWSNTLALPDNPTDLLFDVTASIAIPALMSNCWVSLPLPDFIRVGGLVCAVVAVLVLWQLLAIKAIRAVLTFRLALGTLGVENISAYTMDKMLQALENKPDWVNLPGHQRQEACNDACDSFKQAKIGKGFAKFKSCKAKSQVIKFKSGNYKNGTWYPKTTKGLIYQAHQMSTSPSTNGF